jgi:hypothetical protein
MMFENWLRKERIIVKKLFEKEYPKETNMDAVKFIVEQARMCNSHTEDMECESCGLNNSEYCTKLCDSLISRAGAEEAVRIVEAWSERNPARTRQNVMSSFFPTSQFDSNGVLNVCPAYIDARKRDESTGGCGDMTSDCHDCRKEYWLEDIE